MEGTIKNIDELRHEIEMLEAYRAQQTAALKYRLSSPSAIYTSILSIFGKSKPNNKKKGLFSQDAINILSRFVIPYGLNKTLFRKSNVFTKTAVSLLSQKVANYVSTDSIKGIWDQVQSVAEKLLKKNKDTPAEPEKNLPADVPSV